LGPKDVRSLNVVAIGGGTGLSTILKGLKKYVPHPGQAAAEVAAEQGAVIGSLSAVVTVTDDGGSSGRLRKELNVLPPGDIRNCIVALSEDEALLSRLFQYRFAKGSGLEGHNFGNLFVTALTAITGDFAEAVRMASDVLAIRGVIFPATTANVELEATMKDGSIVRGETSITASQQRIAEVRLLPPDAEPLPPTLEAIERADLITMGPGSLFTSMVPNLLVHGIPDAIQASKAVKVFVCNLMTQANESLGMSAVQHIHALRAHAAGKRLFDYALLNDRPVSAELKKKYAGEGAEQIRADAATVAELEALGLRVVTGDFLEEGNVARHATDRIARELLRIVEHTGAPVGAPR